MERPTTQLFYTCCEVWEEIEGPLTVCWVCSSTGTSIKLKDLPAFHPWTKVNYLAHKQSATRPYL